MPICPQYSWSQTKETVSVEVKLTGLTKRLLRDFVEITPIFFSLNFSPYLLQLDFERNIDTYNIKVFIRNNNILFCFKKKIEEMWDDIVCNESKNLVFERRQASLAELFEKRKKLEKERKAAQKRRLSNAEKIVWKQESIHKKTMEALENQEKSLASSHVKSWLQDKIEHNESKAQRPVVSQVSETPQNPSMSDTSNIANTSNTTGLLGSNAIHHLGSAFSSLHSKLEPIMEETDEISQPDVSTNDKPEQTDNTNKSNDIIDHRIGCESESEDEKSCSNEPKQPIESRTVKVAQAPKLPPIRSNKNKIVKTNFSKWDYVVPQRQNVAPPEFTKTKFLQGLKKETAARNDKKHTQNTDDNSEAANIEEMEPKFMIDKANKFFEKKDFESCTNMYTHILEVTKGKDPLLTVQTYCSLAQTYTCMMNQNNDNLGKDDKTATREKSIKFLTNALDAANQACNTIETLITQSSKRYQNHRRVATKNRPLSEQKEIIFQMIASFQRGILSFEQVSCKVGTLKCVESVQEDGIKCCNHVKLDLNKGMNILGTESNVTQTILNNNMMNSIFTFSMLSRLQERSKTILERQLVIIAKYFDMNLQKCKCDLLIKTNKKEALKKYQNLIKKLKSEKSNPFIILRKQCLNNESIVHYSMKDYECCVDRCQQILKISETLKSSESKIYVRMGQCFLGLWNKSDKELGQCKESDELLAKSLQNFQRASQIDAKHEKFVNQVVCLMDRQ